MKLRRSEKLNFMNVIKISKNTLVQQTSDIGMGTDTIWRDAVKVQLKLSKWISLLMIILFNDIVKA